MQHPIRHAFPLVCPRRGETMRLLAFLTDPFSIRRVLTRAPREAWSGEPTRPPDLHPPRGPPEPEPEAELDAGRDQARSLLAQLRE